jgi:hypothetical protein
LYLRSLAFGKRRTKPGAAGARAIARKTGEQSGNPGTPLLSLPDQIGLQGHPHMAPGPNFLAQSHHRFG